MSLESVGELSLEPPPDAPLRGEEQADCGCWLTPGQVVTFRNAELCMGHALLEIAELVLDDRLTEIPTLVNARDLFDQARAEVETKLKRAVLRPLSPLARAIGEVCRPPAGGRHG